MHALNPLGEPGILSIGACTALENTIIAHKAKHRVRLQAAGAPCGTIMKSPLLSAEPPSPTHRTQGLTLQQQRNMFAGLSRAAPPVWLESDDGGVNTDVDGDGKAGENDALKRGGSATSTMEWRPLSMEQVAVRRIARHTPHVTRHRLTASCCSPAPAHHLTPSSRFIVAPAGTPTCCCSGHHIWPEAARTRSNILLFRLLHEGRDPPQPLLSEKEWLLLSPFDKWQLFGKPPFKLILHLLLVCLLMVQVSYRATTLNSASIDALSAFNHFFLPQGAQWIDGAYRADLFTTQEFNGSVTKVVKGYTSLLADSVDMFSRGPSPPTLLLQQYTSIPGSPSFDGSVIQTSQLMRDEWPQFALLNLTHEQLKQQLLAPLVSMDVQLSLQQTLASAALEKPLCVLWDLGINWAFSSRGGLVRITLSVASRTCPPPMGVNSKFSIRSVSYCIAAVSVVLAVLTMKSFHHSLDLFFSVRSHMRTLPAPSSRGRQRRSNAFSALEFEMKWELFSEFVRLRDVISMLSACITFAYAIQDLFSDVDNDIISLQLGCCIFASLVQLILYLRFFPKFYLLNNSVQMALPRILRLLFSVVPLFLAFVMAGQMWFGSYSPNFVSTRRAAGFLFAIMQGDGVGDGFLQTYRGAGSLQWTLSALSQLFVYSFVVFFIYSVLNVFVTILQESFLRVRKHIHSELQQRRQLKMQVCELRKSLDAATPAHIFILSCVVSERRNCALARRTPGTRPTFPCSR